MPRKRLRGNVFRLYKAPEIEGRSYKPRHDLKISLPALQDTLSRQLAPRFGELPSGVTQLLEAASAEELDAWADEILVAGSFDELFGRT